MRLPDWMLQQFEEGDCSHCHKKLVPSGIKAQGIAEEKSPSQKKVKYIHFYQYICPKCKLETRFKFPTDWEEFMESMVEVAEAEWEEAHPRKPVEGISDEEVESVKKLLDTMSNSRESFTDFLTKIGVNVSDYENDENK